MSGCGRGSIRKAISQVPSRLPAVRPRAAILLGRRTGAGGARVANAEWLFLVCRQEIRLEGRKAKGSVRRVLLRRGRHCGSCDGLSGKSYAIVPECSVETVRVALLRRPCASATVTRLVVE